MVKRAVPLELSKRVWKIIDTQFKVNGESDSEVLSNIIKKYFAQNGYYPSADSLQQEIGLKDIVDILDDKIMSVIDLLEKACSQVPRMERSNARKNNKKCWIFLQKLINNLFFIYNKKLCIVVTVINVINVSMIMILFRYTNTINI